MPRFVLFAPALAPLGARERTGVGRVDRRDHRHDHGGPENNLISLGTGIDANGIEDVAGITAGPGCTQSDPATVTCGALFGHRIDPDLGAGDDRIAGTIGRLGIVEGRPGDDEISGGEDGNTLSGGAGPTRSSEVPATTPSTAAPASTGSTAMCPAPTPAGPTRSTPATTRATRVTLTRVAVASARPSGATEVSRESAR